MLAEYLNRYPLYWAPGWGWVILALAPWSPLIRFTLEVTHDPSR